VDYQLRENSTEIEDKLAKYITFICLNMPQSLVIDKKGGRKGLKFITKKDWNAIKYKGDFTNEKCQDIVKRFDAYLAFILDSHKIKTPQKNTSYQPQQTEVKLVSNYAINSVKTGTFNFDASSGFKFSELEKMITPLDEEIAICVDSYITSQYVLFQQVNHTYITSNREIGLKSFAANNSVMLSFFLYQTVFAQVVPTILGLF